MMRKLFSLLAIGFLVLGGQATAQNTADAARQRDAEAKQARSQLNARESKDARKAAKQYMKEGWTVTPGALPIEKQLDKAYLMQYERDDSGYPKYLMGEAMSIGENYDAARMQAQELAKQNLAGQLQTEITALVDNSLANKQLSAEEAASITETVVAGKSLISQRLGRMIPLVEMYRTLDNKNKEVLIRVAYNSAMAREAAKNVMREELEKKGEDLHEKLEQLLGW